jgi:hypothetical protein
VKGWKTMYQSSRSWKQVGVATLISHKGEFSQNWKFFSNEGSYLLIRCNTGKYIWLKCQCSLSHKPNITEHKGATIMGDFNTSLSSIDKKSRKVSQG